jgi:hypothetical protein
MAPAGIIALAMGVMQWFHAQKSLWIFLTAIPVSLAFVAGSAGAIRTRPWLTMIVVPMVFLAAVFISVVPGVNMYGLSP